MHESVNTVMYRSKRKIVNDKKFTEIIDDLIWYAFKLD